ncbi:hypothetical protein A3860_25475 [Niastella vici]|uniref:Uncharacterized protein n=1 Tax=Niastella vici TaxID=1703345 RepID=A0A1V9FY18_9BACT|nr:hypothetical protein [Niastella vici]OQP63243.1 hypothetical protein A3860_25475 [Niastella vici]
MRIRIPKLLYATASIFMISPAIKAQWKSGLNGSQYIISGNVSVGPVNAPLYPLTISKDGTAYNSFGKTKYIRVLVNEGNQTGGGIAVSDDVGFFDCNDGI